MSKFIKGILRHVKNEDEDCTAHPVRPAPRIRPPYLLLTLPPLQLITRGLMSNAVVEHALFWGLIRWLVGLSQPSSHLDS